MSGEEKRAYILHVPTFVTQEQIMADDMLQLIRRFDAAWVMQAKDWYNYWGMFALKSEADQYAFCEECRKLGIELEIDTREAYVEARYVPGW